MSLIDRILGRQQEAEQMEMPEIVLTREDLERIKAGEALERPVSDGTTMQLVGVVSPERHRLTGAFIALAGEEVFALENGYWKDFPHSSDPADKGVHTLAEDFGGSYRLFCRG